MNHYRPATQDAGARASSATPTFFMVATAALALATLAGTAYAEIYQWRDANGRVQFGDKPPINADATVTTIEPPKIPAPQTDDDANDPRKVYERTNRLFDAQEKTRREAERKQTEANAVSKNACAEARDREWIMTGRVAFTDKNGNEIHKTEAERVKMLAEIKTWIAKNCP